VPLRYVFDKYAYCGYGVPAKRDHGPIVRTTFLRTGSSTTRTGTNSTTPENLRYQQILQQLNCVRKDNRPLTSRFKGVSKKVKNGPEWCAVESTTYVGYHTEREAAIAAATSYVRAYGTWAETSDLLFTEDQSRWRHCCHRKKCTRRSLCIHRHLGRTCPQDHLGTGVELLKNGRYTAAYRGNIWGPSAISNLRWLIARRTWPWYKA
jgi:hypothetical protein